LLNWSLNQQAGIRCIKQQIDIQKISEEAYQIFKESIASKGINFKLLVNPESSVFADYNMPFSY
jgi:hypothetical protein